MDRPKTATENRRRRPLKNPAAQSAKSVKYSVHSRSGARFTEVKPVFTKDEKYVLLSTRREVRVYSTTTGELIRPLTWENAKGSIVSVMLHPENEYRLITVSSVGQVLVWDWSDGSLISKQIQMLGEVVASILVGTTFIWSDDKQISASRNFPEFKQIHPINKMASCRGFHYNGEQILAHGEKSIFLFKLKKEGYSTEHEHINLTTTPTAFAMSLNAYAYSDASGSIWLHRLLPHNVDRPPAPSRLHWHSSAVHSLEFALNGQYLLSGGGEGVLVLWQLEKSNRQNLPRIARAITTIATSATSKLYAVRTDDNCVKIISATNLNLQAEIVGPRSTFGMPMSTTHGDELLLTTGGEVQSWNLASGRTSFLLPVVARTFAGQVRDEFRSVEASVTACAVSEEWLATLDTWTPPREEAAEFGYTQPQDEVHLKFWKWSGTKYELVARVDTPHTTYRATQVIAGHKSFFTVGDDAIVKLWKQKSVKKDLVGGGTQIVGTTWTCSRIFKLTRPAGPCKIAVSQDNSVLALNTQDQTFLIDIATGDLKDSLSGFSTGRIAGLGFVKHHLVMLGFKRLVVWDLLIGAVSYALCVPSDTTELQLTCAPNVFALTTNEQSKQVKNNAKIFIFDPKSAKPVFREKCTRTLSMSYSAKHGFVQLTDDLEIVKYSDQSVLTTTNTVSTTTDAQKDGPATTGISSLYKPLRKAPVADEVDMQYSVVNSQRLAEIFEDPLKTLESRFDDLALLVLGASQPLTETSA